MKNEPTYKPGEHDFAIIADEVFDDVCQDFSTPEVSAEDIYCKMVEHVKVDWPKEAIGAKEIRKLARAGMEKLLVEKGFKRND